MIVAKGLTKRYGALPVLCGLDVAIARGRVTAILGPNGAGKTTLIKAILGLTRPDAGTLTFDGAAIVGGDAYRARIGYMPQIAHLPENLTGGELLALLRALRGDPDVDERLVDDFGLRGALDMKLRVLSGGTRQKVNAVAAFLFAPDLYVLDEPTSGLDPVASAILKRRIVAECARGRTVILTSHILSEVDELADDVVVLHEGRVRFAGSVADLKRETAQSSSERALAALMLREVAA